MTLAFHPLADIFPLVRESELAELAADIKAHGQRDPIMLAPDKSILDGRNRYLACLKAEVQPTFDHYDGDEASMVAYVVSKNLHRRMLDESQRGMVATRLATLGRGGDHSNSTIVLLPTQAKAAEMLNVSVGTVKRARAVVERGEPELVAAVEQGKVSVSAAARATNLPRAEQVAFAKGDARPEKVAKADVAVEGAGSSHPVAADGQDVRAPIIVPKRTANETGEQRAVRFFLNFASDDLDICNKIMREVGLDLIRDKKRIRELLSAARTVIGEWEKIAARLSSKL